MRSRILFGVLLLTVIGAFAVRTAAEANLKWAIVNLVEPTVIAGKIVAGPVMFVHDDAKMARGEACTTVHRFSPVTGVGEALVSFHCKAYWADAPVKFTAKTNRDVTGPLTLTDYQFAGDTEAHGVPKVEKQGATHDMKGMAGMDCMKDMKDMKDMKGMKCGDDCKDCKDSKPCASCKH